MPRQAITPATYNVTQAFEASAGVLYTFSVFASEAPDGSTQPDCSVTLCGTSSCSPSGHVNSGHELHAYQYLATSSGRDAATFSVSCAQSAFVGLDNVTVQADAAGGAAGQATTTIIQYITETEMIPSTQTQTYWQSSQEHQTVYFYSTATATVENQLIQLSAVSITDTASTVVWATATKKVDVLATRYLHSTVFDLSTSTSRSRTVTYAPCEADSGKDCGVNVALLSSRSYCLSHSEQHRHAATT